MATPGTPVESSLMEVPMALASQKLDPASMGGAAAASASAPAGHHQAGVTG